MPNGEADSIVDINQNVWNFDACFQLLMEKSFYTVVNYRLASKIQEREKEYRQQVSDLYHAMVVSNLLSTDSGIDTRFDLFEKNYKGKTPISISR